jgi:hypothetical protein
MMHTIRIPVERWDDVWDALVASGPISRVSEEPIYVISDQQLRMLRRKKLPFQLLDPPNGKNVDKKHA